VRTSAAPLAQVWRDGARQANLARTLPGIDTLPLDQTAASRIGELLGNARTSDIVDGHVALITGAGDTVLTSDVRDTSCSAFHRHFARRRLRWRTGCASDQPGCSRTPSTSAPAAGSNVGSSSWRLDVCRPERSHRLGKTAFGLKVEESELQDEPGHY
jgi:hypothetical protein